MNTWTVIFPIYGRMCVEVVPSYGQYPRGKFWNRFGLCAWVFSPYRLIYIISFSKMVLLCNIKNCAFAFRLDFNCTRYVSSLPSLWLPDRLATKEAIIVQSIVHWALVLLDMMYSSLKSEKITLQISQGRKKNCKSGNPVRDDAFLHLPHIKIYKTRNYISYKSANFNLFISVDGYFILGTKSNYIMRYLVFITKITTTHHSHIASNHKS